jgi:hypothetical protein
MPDRWRPRQRWGAGLLVATATLLALVAVVADGSPLEAPPAGERFAIDASALFLAFALVVAVGLATLVFALWSLLGEGSRRGGIPARRTWMHVLLGLALVGLLMLLPEAPPPPPEPEAGDTGQATEAVEDEEAEGPRPPVWPVVVIGITFAGAMVAATLGGRRPRPVPDEAPTAPAAADPELARLAFDASIEELLAETDPRRAVIAAYASLLTGLSRAGVPRRTDEAPEEHLERALGALRVPPDPLRTLVVRFEEARFSTHVIDDAAKVAAIDAFRAARASLPTPEPAR